LIWLKIFKRLDALGYVATRPIEFSLNVEIPYATLVIPQNYKLNSYETSKDTFYVPKYEERISKLRTGAVDEYMSADFQPLIEQIKEQKNIVNKTRRIAFTDTIDQEEALLQPKVIDLAPPLYLAEPVEYPDMTIFVSSSFFC
jgi:hypothetical protein